ncbi:MAG: hypothetical protein ACTHMM_17035 [Agriterribacter sp.]
MKTILTCLLSFFIITAATAQIKPQPQPQPQPSQPLPTQPQSQQPALNTKPNSQPGLFLDLKTGQPIDLQYDNKTSMMYNRSTGRPVNFFINNTGDTISSRGFYIVNNYLTKSNDEYMIDKTKADQRENKLWGVKSNQELKLDKNWKQYTGADQTNQ